MLEAILEAQRLSAKVRKKRGGRNNITIAIYVAKEAVSSFCGYSVQDIQ